MTGEKNKFTTHEKLWKLEDGSLSTPKHDEMVLYLLNKENILRLHPCSEIFVSHLEHYRMQYPELSVLFNGRLDLFTEEMFVACTQKNIRLIKSINSEQPIFAKNDFIIGYWDIVVITERGERLYFEVKPTIKSFGETLRQLKTYQAYVPDSKGYTHLFTTDIGFKGAFESQGIHVIEYKK